MKIKITITTESISSSGNPYNQDKFEDESIYEESCSKEAIKKGIAHKLGSDVAITWYSDNSAMVAIKFDDGGEKDYFFDAVEI